MEHPEWFNRAALSSMTRRKCSRNRRRLSFNLDRSSRRERRPDRRRELDRSDVHGRGYVREAPTPEFLAGRVLGFLVRTLPDDRPSIG